MFRNCKNVRILILHVLIAVKVATMDDSTLQKEEAGSPITLAIS
jgi:hypothetical protein